MIKGTKYVRKEYLIGTAITIIVVLLILLVRPRLSGASRLIRRCPVCDRRLVGSANYCSECGSKA